MESQNKAVPRHKTLPPKSDADTWDGAAAELRCRKWASSDGSGDKEKIDWVKLRECAAWYDEDDPENFGSIKLYHHDIEDGKRVTSWPGTAAAMNTLLGGRGGADIPEKDRRSVYDHLVDHYEQFDKEPPEFAAAQKRFWSLRASAEPADEGEGETLDVLIYGVIGGGFWGDEAVYAGQFARDLAAHPNAKTINVHINSMGGSAFDGIAIYNVLRQHPAKVVSIVEGQATSAASLIAMAGDTVRMMRGSMMMIHNPWGWAIGDAADMRKTADLLEKLQSSLVDIYRAKTGRTAEDLQAMLDAETWFTAQEALDARFADEIDEAAPVQARAQGESILVGGVAFPRAMVSGQILAMATGSAPRPSAAEPEPESDSTSPPTSPEPAVQEQADEPVIDESDATPGSPAAETTSAEEDEPVPEPAVVEPAAAAAAMVPPASAEPGPAAVHAPSLVQASAPLTRAMLEAKAPELLAAILAEGAAVERERIKAIEDMAMPGHQALLAQAKFGPEPMSPEQFAMALVRAARGQCQQYLADRIADAAEAAVPGASLPVPLSDEARTDRVIQAAAAARAARRRR